ncbi:MAG: riboflavin synthase [Desulfuromonadales bacterium]|nr:riboflavin synthase [Desulfuromonadales bacterium]
MFTGLIEDLGTLAELRRGGGVASVTIATALPMAELRLGESIAVNGACLTVTIFGAGRFTADVSPETLEKTTIASLQRGARVNLERALRLSDRLGGHLVTGHVDGQARIVERVRQGNAWCFGFQCDSAVSRLIVAKGSVAVDGISLTVNEVLDDRFTVMIIPHTLEQTSLAGLQVGGQVNIETDLIGKYVARLLGAGDQRARGVTLDLLAKSGFL